jgi:hypothetical protein
MMISLLAFAVNLAYAAPVEVRLAVGQAQSVVAVVRDGAGVYPVACNDAGVAPDSGADGIWTCASVDVAGDAADVVLIVDGQLRGAGVVRWSGLDPRVAAVSTSAGLTTVSTDAGSLKPVVGAAASSGGPVVIARLVGYGTGPAPVLVLGSTQLFCHDDGQFPDHGVNDGEPGCAGRVPASSTDVVLRSSPEQLIPLGKITWPEGPIRYLTANIVAGTASAEPFELPLPPLAALGDAATPAEPSASAPVADGGTAVDAAAPAEPSASASGSEPADRAKPPPRVTGPEGADTLFGPLPWIVALIGAAVGIVALRLRGARTYVVRHSLRPLPGPPLFEGGPSATGGALLRVEDPLVFAASLLPILAQGHRVVVAVPGLVDLPPVGGAGVWVAMVPTWEEVAAGVVGLAQTPGAPVALLVIGGATVSDPGAVNPAPLGKLSLALPPGVWMGVVCGLDEAVLASLPAWRVAGPPWVGVKV